MPTFLSCFPIKTRRSDDPLLPPTSSTPTRAGEGKVWVDGCAFCSASSDTGFKIVHEDDELLAFHDRSPRARVHLLIIPREHVVSSVRQLKAEHLPLLRSMVSLAETLVPPDPPPKLGFHIPPFSSVPHLHMHVFSGPHSFLGRFKYPVTTRKGEKGYGWFVTASQVERILDRGGTVDLGRG